MSNRIMGMEKSDTEVSYYQSCSFYSYTASVNYFFYINCFRADEKILFFKMYAHMCACAHTHTNLSTEVKRPFAEFTELSLCLVPSQFHIKKTYMLFLEIISSTILCKLVLMGYIEIKGGK